MSNCTEWCSTMGSCPFAFTEESDVAQNYGCLPTPHDIVDMRVVYGKSWACHSDTSKPCLGAIKYLKAAGQPYKVTELVTEEDDWGKYTLDTPNPINFSILATTR